MAKRKSSYSGQNGACVEVEPLPGGEIAVTDSKDPNLPPLRLERTAFGSLLAEIKSGRYDDPRRGA